jgi:hypothetical protein
VGVWDGTGMIATIMRRGRKTGPGNPYPIQPPVLKLLASPGNTPTKTYPSPERRPDLRSSFSFDLNSKACLADFPLFIFIQIYLFFI